MYTSTRFAVAVHTLAFIAMRSGSNCSITSDMIAESVNTNPVVIRRILGVLRQAQLVRSQSGCGGGWALAQPASAITLRQIYRAIENDPLFALHHRPNPRCEVGQNMLGVLGRYFKDAEQAMEERLERVSVAEVMREIGARAPKLKTVQATDRHGQSTIK
jgi:Rrf2 family protein